MLRAAATAGFPARLAAKRPRAATAATRVVVVGAEVRSMLFRALRCGPVPVPRRKACFCSNADARSGPEAVEGAEATGGEEGEGENASSAIVPAAFRPEDCHTVHPLTIGSALSCFLQSRPCYPFVPIICQILLNNCLVRAFVRKGNCSDLQPIDKDLWRLNSPKQLSGTQPGVMIFLNSLFHDIWHSFSSFQRRNKVVAARKRFQRRTCFLLS
jgi:hypothetical protein